MENTVEIQISDAQKAIQNLNSSLNTLKNTLNNTINSTKTNKLKDNIDSSTKQVSNLKKALGLGTIYIGLKKTAQAMWSMAQSNINLIETNNLFEVSMGKVVNQYGELDKAQSKYYLDAMAFQDEMNEKLLTNKAELKNYQAMYYSMFKSQGIDRDASYLMSESLTKAGYDIASLYNLSVSDAMDKIKSGIAGQVEPLRKIGVDISESALTKVIREAGINDRSVQQLSYAEKEVARYISILEQAGQAQGDFAKTFDQPANQLKILTNQFEELKQVAGSFVVNAFGGILVYANAIIMVIKEILMAFAELFGWDLETGGADLSSSLGVDDLGTSLGTASGKAKELKKQLMGFDEINNITPQTNSGGSGSGGVATGVDDKLLKSLKEWDNKMSNISSKAKEIKDAMLEWLGLSDGIPKTFDEWWKKLGKIQKTLIVIGGIVGGIYVIGKITKLVNWLKTLITILKTGKGATTTFGLGLQTIGKVVNGLKSGFSTIISWITMVVGQYRVFRSEGNSVIESLRLTKTSLNETNQGFLSLIPNVAKVVGGLTGLIASGALAYTSMQDLSNGTIGTGEAMLKLTGSIAGATASGALLGSTFGPVGIAIGAVTGLVISGATALIGYTNATEEVKEAFSNIGEGAVGFVEGIQSATSHLQSFNSTLFASTEEQQKLQGNMNEIQQAITDICKKASDERRNLTNEEIQKLDEYFAKLRELKNREVEIQNQIAQAITQQAITNAETFQGSLDEYKQQSQEWIKTAEEQSAKTLEVIKEGSIQEVALLNQRYGEQATMQNEAYAKEYNEIIKQRDEKIKQAQNEVLKVNEAYANGYLERSKTNDSFYNTLKEFTTKQENLQTAHNEKIRQIKDGELWYVTNKNQAIQSENETFAFHQKDNWEQMYKTMSEEQEKELGVWLAMVSQTEMYGGKIDKETQDLVDSILESYDSMPENTRNAMKNAMKPMLEEMEKKEPSLYTKATNIATGILNRLKKAFDIHSPSRKTREIFKNLMLGMGLGIEDEENSIYEQTSNVAERVLSNLDLSNSLKQLKGGIKINTKDFAVDTNQYVDYGTISGNINAQSQVTVGNNIVQGIAQAVSQAMRNTDINVNIEAKTEEGVIVKKATEGIKDFVRQTGELPFPVPV